MARKKDKISNNSMMVLGLIAFIVSMFATLGVLGNYSITGLAAGDTEYARVNVTLEAIIQTSLPDASSISFGSMEPNELNATGNTSGNPPEGIEIQNDGNVRIDVNITSKKAVGTLFNGTTAADMFEWNCSLNSNSTSNLLYGNCNLSNWASVATTTTGSGAAGVPFVGALNFTDITDNATLNIKICIPADEPVWTTGTTITFSAWQIG